MKAPKAIFFDVGNTLLFPNWKQILAPLHERNIAVHPEQLRALECRTKREFDENLQSGKTTPGFWQIFYSHLLEELRLGDGRLLDALLKGTHASSNWDQIRPRTRNSLDRFRKKCSLGVISNADGKVARTLAKREIANCFLTITDSGLIGHEKPHPAIFQAALRDLGATAVESLYVGDVYSVDYLGATRAGMQAIMFDVCGAYRDRDLPRVESLEDLERKLESIS